MSGSGVEEAAQLEACARAGGLTQIPLEELHRQAFFRVLGEEARIPPADLSAIRRRELLGLAKALGGTPGGRGASPAGRGRPGGLAQARGYRLPERLADRPGHSR